MKNVILILIVLILSGCSVAQDNSELSALEKQLQDLKQSIEQNEETIESLKDDLAALESPQLTPISEEWANQLVYADVFYWTNAHQMAQQPFITYDANSDTTIIQFLRINLKMTIEGRIPDKIVVHRSAFGIDFGYQTSETIDGIASYFILSNSWGFLSISGNRSIVSGHDMDSILDEQQEAEVAEFLRRKITFMEGN